jgi:hypothetical protein
MLADRAEPDSAGGGNRTLARAPASRPHIRFRCEPFCYFFAITIR